MGRNLKSFAMIALVAMIVAACGTPLGGMGGPPDRGPGNFGVGAGGGAGEKCKTLVEQNREQFLETAQLLNLTPTQLVLWESYRASVNVLVAEQLKLDPGPEHRRNALQQIDGKLDAARHRLTTLEQVAGQAAALYRSFDEAQKKTADQHLAATIPALSSGMVCQGSGSGTGERGTPGRPVGQ